MKTDYDIVIVGAGIAGAAVAHHLAKRSRPPAVLVLERESEPGMHSTGRNAAIVRDVHVEDSLAPLLREGADFIRTGALARFEPVGVMLLEVGGDDVRPHFARARGTGAWQAACGVVDVAALLQAYLHGVPLSCGTRLESWERRGERLRLQTSRGELTCGLLVNAAGPWAGQVGGLPLQPLNRTIFATPPLDWVDPNWSCVWHVTSGLYFRPESGGLLLSVCDERPAAPGDYVEEPALLEELAGKLERLQPDLADISIRSGWVGQRTFAPDRHFVIGFDPREPRLFHVAGLGGHGVTASYGVGRLAAELIARGPGVVGGARGAGVFDPARLPAR
jgi:D-arginine dehydrogenase